MNNCDAQYNWIKHNQPQIIGLNLKCETHLSTLIFFFYSTQYYFS